RTGVLDHNRGPVACGRRPGDADPAAVLQRCGPPPALLDPGFSPVHHADPAAFTGRLGVSRTLPGRPPAGVYLHLGRAGGVQLRRLADHAQDDLSSGLTPPTEAGDPAVKPCRSVKNPNLRETDF